MLSSIATALALSTLVSASPLQHRQASTTKQVLFSGPGAIFTADFDPTSSAFTITSNTSVSGVPSWLLTNGPIVYTVDESTTTLSVHTFDSASKTLTKLSDIQGATGLVSLEFNAEKTVMFGASFIDGVIDIFDVDPATGALSNLRQLVSDDELGPDATRQDAPHVHQVLRDPSGDFIVAADLGTDTMLVVGQNADTGDFEIVSRVRTSRPGCGPRHLAFFPASGEVATHVLLVCEMLNLVEVFAVSYEGGVLQLAQTGATVSTFPEDGVDADVFAEFVPTQDSVPNAGEILLSADSKHVYVSNRLTGNDVDSIVHFSVEGVAFAADEEAGEVTLEIGEVGLTRCSFVNSGGIRPRMFSFSKDESTLFSSNQQGAQGVVAFARDPETGELTLGEGGLSNDQFDLAKDPANPLGPQYIQEF